MYHMLKLCFLCVCVCVVTKILPNLCLLLPNEKENRRTMPKFWFYKTFYFSLSTTSAISTARVPFCDILLPDIDYALHTMHYTKHTPSGFLYTNTRRGRDCSPLQRCVIISIWRLHELDQTGLLASCFARWYIVKDGVCGSLFSVVFSSICHVHGI